MKILIKEKVYDKKIASRIYCLLSIVGSGSLAFCFAKYEPINDNIIIQNSLSLYICLVIATFTLLLLLMYEHKRKVHEKKLKYLAKNSQQNKVSSLFSEKKAALVNVISRLCGGIVFISFFLHLCDWTSSGIVIYLSKWGSFENMSIAILIMLILINIIYHKRRLG